MDTTLDPVVRWFAVGASALLLIVGMWGLLVPHHYRQTLLGLCARLPDQKSIAPFVQFISGNRSVILLRLFSLFPIGLGIALLATIL